MCIIFAEMSVSLWPTFKLSCFFIIEFYEVFIYFEYQSFIRCVLYKYSLKVCNLSSHSLDTVFFFFSDSEIKGRLYYLFSPLIYFIPC